MKFFTSHRKGIAMIALLSFVYLIHITAKPLSAAPAPAAANTAAASSTDTDGPGAIEQRGPVSYGSPRKSPLIPIIIGVVLVGAIVAVLVLVVFKTKYNLTGGNWTVTIAIGTVGGTSYNDFQEVYTFTGSKSQGTFTDSANDAGTYTLDGKKVSFRYNASTGVDLSYSGNFTGKNTMSGTVNGTLYDLQTGAAVPINGKPWDGARSGGSSSVTSPGTLQKSLKKRPGK